MSSEDGVATTMVSAADGADDPDCGDKSNDADPNTATVVVPKKEEDSNGETTTAATGDTDAAAAPAATEGADKAGALAATSRRRSRWGTSDTAAEPEKKKSRWGSVDTPAAPVADPQAGASSALTLKLQEIAMKMMNPLDHQDPNDRYVTHSVCVFLFFSLAFLFPSLFFLSSRSLNFHFSLLSIRFTGNRRQSLFTTHLVSASTRKNNGYVKV